jgi:hypothetical protein
MKSNRVIIVIITKYVSIANLSQCDFFILFTHRWRVHLTFWRFQIRLPTGDRPVWELFPGFTQYLQENSVSRTLRAYLSPTNIIVLSRVRGSVTYSNGFWIGWLDLLTLLTQLLLITIAYSRWLASIPYWTTSVFSSTVTDLVLIYESVTSSASVVPG